ncbi:hypothetical protein AK830_g8324 [Neonectria ditissima]|uniref:Uncharacterized protein n=1 Tax=Neonectria ditissima TaxID=78410 RepID=A0A0P7AUP1_9HYPO|nr:hypothetical protein AK830_g8324 [Neonectria ditissima]
MCRIQRLWERTIDEIAAEHERLDGVIAAGGIQQLTPAQNTAEEANKMLAVKCTAVFMTITNLGACHAAFASTRKLDTEGPVPLSRLKAVPPV